MYTSACPSISLVTSMTSAGVAPFGIVTVSIHITLVACFTLINICDGNGGVNFRSILIFGGPIFMAHRVDN